MNNQKRKHSSGYGLLITDFWDGKVMTLDELEKIEDLAYKRMPIDHQLILKLAAAYRNALQRIENAESIKDELLRRIRTGETVNLQEYPA